MQCNCQLVVFYKIAPMAIFFAAAGIKIPLLNFFPYLRHLMLYCFGVLRCDDDFFFALFFLFIRLHKIKFRTNHFPVFLFVIVN